VILDKLIPEFSVRLAARPPSMSPSMGSTKPTGFENSATSSALPLPEMIFIGDAVFPGGNDYPAEEAGVFSIEVKDPHETKRVIEAIIACLEVS